MPNQRLRNRPTTATDTLAHAQRLAAIAVDMMYRFVPGTRTVTIEGISEKLTVTGEFIEHWWGQSIQFTARDAHGDVAAAAESSVVLNDRGCGSISSRARQFRTSGMLWTHTGQPVNIASIRPALDSYTASHGEISYRLDKQLHDHREELKTVWVLSSSRDDFTPIRFAGLVGAVTHLSHTLAGESK